MKMKLKSLLSELNQEPARVMNAIEQKYPAMTVVTELTAEQEAFIREMFSTKNPSQRSLPSRPILPGEASADSVVDVGREYDALEIMLMSSIVSGVSKNIKDRHQAERNLIELVTSYLKTGGVFPPGISPEVEKIVSDFARILVEEEMRVTTIKGFLPMHVSIHGTNVELEPFIDQSIWSFYGDKGCFVAVDSPLLEAEVIA